MHFSLCQERIGVNCHQCIDYRGEFNKIKSIFSKLMWFGRQLFNAVLTNDWNDDKTEHRPYGAPFWALREPTLFEANRAKGNDATLWSKGYLPCGDSYNPAHHNQRQQAPHLTAPTTKATSTWDEYVGSPWEEGTLGQAVPRWCISGTICLSGFQLRWSQ